MFFDIGDFRRKRRQTSVLTSAFQQSVISVDDSVFHNFLFFIMMNQRLFGAFSTCAHRSVACNALILAEIFFRSN